MKCDQDDYIKVLNLLESFNVSIPSFKHGLEVDFIMFSKETNTFKFKADEESNRAIDSSFPPMAVIPFFDIDIFIRYTGVMFIHNDLYPCFHFSFFPDKKSPISSGVNINARNIGEAYLKFKKTNPSIEPFCVHDKSQL